MKNKGNIADELADTNCRRLYGSGIILSIIGLKLV